MLNAIEFFEIYVYTLMLYFMGPLIFIYIAAHALYVYYFWMNGVQFPILGMLPFARVYMYRNLSGISLGWCVGYTVLTLMSLLLPSVFIWAIWLGVGFMLELSFANSSIDDKQVLYALLPPYKFYRLFREARALAEVESEE